MQINGVELIFDAYDADQMDRYLAGLKAMETPIVGDDTDALRAQVNAYRVFFDTTFGPGTADALFGDKQSVRACLDAFTAVLDDIERQRAEYDALMQRYAPNRAARRATK